MHQGLMPMSSSARASKFYGFLEETREIAWLAATVTVLSSTSVALTVLMAIVLFGA
jgi:hypothetical protein